MRKINKWDYQYLELANYLGQMSNCAAKQIGCLIVKNGDTIISSGINGTPKGYTNCNEIFFKKNDEWYSKLASDKNDYVVNEGIKYYKIKNTDMTHKEFTLNHEVHAEINAISKMARVGVSTDDCSLYCTYSPCRDCAKAIIASGIKEVFYIKEFDDSDEVIEFLNANDVEINKLYIDGV